MISRYLLEIDSSPLGTTDWDLVGIALTRTEPTRDRARELEVGVDSMILVV